MVVSSPQCGGTYSLFSRFPLGGNHGQGILPVIPLELQGKKHQPFSITQPFQKCAKQKGYSTKALGQQYRKKARSTTVDLLSAAKTSSYGTGARHRAKGLPVPQQAGSAGGFSPRGPMGTDSAASLRKRGKASPPAGRCAGRRFGMCGKAVPRLEPAPPHTHSHTLSQQHVFIYYMKSEGMIPYFFSLR